MKSEGKASCQLSLTVADCSVLWLAYIHLLSWEQLPWKLWDPLNNMSGKIVQKVGIDMV